MKIKIIKGKWFYIGRHGKRGQKIGHLGYSVSSKRLKYSRINNGEWYNPSSEYFCQTDFEEITGIKLEPGEGQYQAQVVVKQKVK